MLSPKLQKATISITFDRSMFQLINLTVFSVQHTRSLCVYPLSLVIYNLTDPCARQQDGRKRSASRSSRFIP